MKKKGNGKRRVYSPEFKAGTVALLEKREHSVRHIAADLGLNENMLRKWVQKAQEVHDNGLKAFPGHGRPRDEELVRLRKEAKAQRAADEILKKAAGIFAQGKPSVMVYQFMKEHKGRYTVKEMTGVFGMSGSAYYKWAKHGVSNIRRQDDADLVRLIRQIVEKHHRQYGSPRVRAELRQVHGKRVSLKKVARLMRENGLNARVKHSLCTDNPVKSWIAGLR